MSLFRKPKVLLSQDWCQILGEVEVVIEDIVLERPAEAVVERQTLDESARRPDRRNESDRSPEYRYT